MVWTGTPLAWSALLYSALWYRCLARLLMTAFCPLPSNLVNLPSFTPETTARAQMITTTLCGWTKMVPEYILVVAWETWHGSFGKQCSKTTLETSDFDYFSLFAFFQLIHKRIFCNLSYSHKLCKIPVLRHKSEVVSDTIFDTLVHMFAWGFFVKIFS